MKKIEYQLLTAGARHALTAAGGYLVANGYATDSQSAQLIGGGLALIGIVWSYFNKKNTVAATTSSPTDQLAAPKENELQKLKDKIKKGL